MKNRKGFTLIELLAVITIMGILMIVAIPAVSRTIENTRRDTFMNTAKQYANEVKTQWAADNISCKTASSSSMETVSSAVPNGDYFVPISSANDWATQNVSKNMSISGADKAQENGRLLIDQGGKSSWGGAEVYGFVAISVASIGTKGDKTIKYYAALVDTGGHGIPTSLANGTGKKESSKLKRADIQTSGAALAALTGTNYECQIDS